MYLELYQKMYSSKKRTQKNILEVGMYKGGSIQLWDDFFTEDTIYELDSINMTDVMNKISNEDDLYKSIDINEFDTNITKDECFISDFLSKKIKCDFRMDSNNHSLENMKKFIKIFADRLTYDGILIIEDVQNKKWIEILKEEVPEYLKEYIEVYDLNSKNDYNDIVFVINKKQQ